LKDDRYVLYKATDGVEALSMAEDVYPDLILLDVVIPRMDGITVCSTLKQQDRFSRFKHVPIVMSTSLTEVEKRVEAIQAGADDILIKPVDSKLLKERVRTLLEAKDEFESILASYRDAERNATVDPLTGLYNRRYMEGIMTREFMNARRHGRDLSVLMMDVDHFKNYNDKFGHQAGDNILKGVSRIFRDIVREVDLVARYGGEEFIAILPETPPDMAAMVAERIRTAVEDGNEVTISIGAASYPGDSTDMADLIKDADTALYAAKDAGRNRTVKFNDINNRECAA
ncbi:MAG TPA: diguanylate cyclase, partial [Nitrospirota bacterium]